MKFSVVIPCYNVAPWVGEALKSVAAQTHAPHEIVCVDDGSTDETLAAVRASGVKVKLIETPHVNAAAARNAGIEAATGDWIAFQDADDVWYPDHLARAAALLSDARDDACLSLSDLLGEDGRVVPRPNPWRIAEPTRGLSALRFLEESEALKAFSLPGCAIRREALVAAGGFDPSMKRRHDFDMWLRVLKGRTWSYDPRTSSAIRTGRPGRISAATAECEYFLLRALLRNREAYSGATMDRYLAYAAWTSVRESALHGSSADRAKARAQAWPWLGAKDRLRCAGFELCPPLFRWLIKRRDRAQEGASAS
ncbi:MAG: glycosyltransferase family 2 protein [Planctomycetota bacterium]|nr:glycosyltransferase family 2 protein [Planctomycetota bacterium]